MEDTVNAPSGDLCHLRFINVSCRRCETTAWLPFPKGISAIYDAIL